MAERKSREEIVDEMNPEKLKLTLKNMETKAFTEFVKEYRKSTDGELQQGAPKNLAVINDGDQVVDGIDARDCREGSMHEDRHAVEATGADDCSYVNPNQVSLEITVLLAHFELL